MEDQLSIELPSWALPRERVAISASWKRTLKMDRITIKIPPEFEFEDALNVEKCSYEKSTIILEGMCQTEEKFSENDYVSIVISSPIQNELKKSYPIIWRFYFQNNLLEEKICQFRVFRPRIDIIKHPSALRLTDEGLKPKLELTLQWLGFGDVNVSLGVRIGGIFASRGRSLFEEIINRIYQIVIKGENTTILDNSIKYQEPSSYIIDPESIKSITEQILMILNGKTSALETDDDIIDAVSSWLREKSIANEIDEYLASTVETLLLQVLSETLERNPISGVKMSSPRTEIDAQILVPVTHLKVEIHYSDNLDNMYSTQDLEIPVTDERSEECRRKPLYEVIRLKEWIDSSWKNVEMMKID